MRAVSLLYHDVVRPRTESTSGFKGPKRFRQYKITNVEFAEHLLMLTNMLRNAPALAPSALQVPPAHRPLFLTFDDGGKSSAAEIGPRMNRLGWLGHFFVVTGSIGQKTFINEAQIRELAERGHVVGSHSHTHPERMTALSDEELLEEWKTSIESMSDILGRRVQSASVPGPFFNRRVAEAAAKAGIRILFTSEPTTRSTQVGDCSVFGRYPIRKGTRPETIAHLVESDTVARVGQWVRWNFRRSARTMGGDYYRKAWQWLSER